MKYRREFDFCPLIDVSERRIDMIESYGNLSGESHERSDSGAGVFTVTQINEYAKMLIDGNEVMKNVCIKGEISYFVNHRRGPLYFTLKDSGGVLRAVMFGSQASKLKFVPEYGMKVVAHGRISVYVQGGQYQLTADRLEPDGAGALYIAFEQLKRRLEAEGLFSQARKRPLPKIPTRIGIITSPTGAAVRDMINVTGRRFPYAEIVIFPSLVQGAEAVGDLCEGIRYFNSEKRVDVIIIGRGGGSVEDLWAFNDESLARTIRASEIPVISAVGHETDFTIADFASDRRAPTPSAAAEIAVPDTLVLKRQIGNIVGRMEQLISHNLKSMRQRLDGLSGRRCMTDPASVTESRRMVLLMLEKQLDAAAESMLSYKRSDFARITSELRTLNPMSVISRGYSAVFDGGGALVKSIEQLNEGDRFTFRASDGEIDGTVTGKRSIDKPGLIQRTDGKGVCL